MTATTENLNLLITAINENLNSEHMRISKWVIESKTPTLDNQNICYLTQDIERHYILYNDIYMNIDEVNKEIISYNDIDKLEYDIPQVKIEIETHFSHLEQNNKSHIIASNINNIMFHGGLKWKKRDNAAAALFDCLNNMANSNKQFLELNIQTYIDGYAAHNASKYNDTHIIKIKDSRDIKFNGVLIYGNNTKETYVYRTKWCKLILVKPNAFNKEGKNFKIIEAEFNKDNRDINTVCNLIIDFFGCSDEAKKIYETLHINNNDYIF